MTTLIEKSLLQVDNAGQYRLHGLLRQFAAGYLVEAAAVQAAFVACFCQQTAVWQQTIGSPSTIHALRRDLTHLLAAWEQTTDAGCLAALLDTIAGYFWHDSRANERLIHLQKAVSRPNLPPRVAAQLWGWLGYFQIILRQLAAAEQSFMQQRILATKHQFVDLEGIAHGGLARLWIEKTLFAEAKQAAQQSLMLLSQASTPSPWGLIQARQVLASLLFTRGNGRWPRSFCAGNCSW